MSAFTVGRVGLDIALSEIETWELSGDRVSASGVLLADSISDAKALRQQLNGYVGNGDEEVVPVTWSEDSSVDGFYRVVEVQVSTVPASYYANWFPFSLTLERVAGFAGPLMETIIVGALRTNSHTITSANAVAVIGVPDTALEFYDSSDPADTDLFTRTSADGAIRLVTADSYTRRQTFALAPQDWYRGAAQIETGTTYRTVVGQQIPAEMDTWRLSNGLLRVTPAAGGGFGLSAYNGASWSTPKVLTLRAGGAPGTQMNVSLFELSSSLRVLRNSPEECIVRCSLVVPSELITDVNLGSIRADIDLALRRGERMVRGFFQTTTGTFSWGIGVTVAEAATTLTGGIRATADDADGHRFVLSTPQAFTADTTNGRVDLNADSASFSFAAGLEVDGSSAAANDAAQPLIYEYMAATSERVVVASR